MQHAVGVGPSVKLGASSLTPVPPRPSLPQVASSMLLSSNGHTAHAPHSGGFHVPPAHGAAIERPHAPVSMQMGGDKPLTEGACHPPVFLVACLQLLAAGPQLTTPLPPPLSLSQVSAAPVKPPPPLPRPSDKAKSPSKGIVAPASPSEDRPSQGNGEEEGVESLDCAAQQGQQAGGGRCAAAAEPAGASSSGKGGKAAANKAAPTTTAGVKAAGGGKTAPPPSSSSSSSSSTAPAAPMTALNASIVIQMAVTQVRAGEEAWRGSFVGGAYWEGGG